MQNAAKFIDVSDSNKVSYVNTGCVLKYLVLFIIFGLMWCLLRVYCVYKKGGGLLYKKQYIYHHSKNVYVCVFDFFLFWFLNG